MLEQIRIFENNILALEVIDGFTEADEKFAQKLFNEKLEKGFETINILVKIDEYKLSKTSTKAFFEDVIFILRKFKNLGHIAIIAHSKILKIMVPIDNLFFERSSKGREERYFDISQIDQAWEFINN